MGWDVRCLVYVEIGAARWWCNMLGFAHGKAVWRRCVVKWMREESFSKVVRGR